MKSGITAKVKSLSASAAVDASFYALNFATHRATLAARYAISPQLDLLIDSEYREQRKNPLRSSADDAFTVSASLTWSPVAASGFDVALAADNLTDDDFEQFPGTPAIGRQLSLRASYSW